MDGKDSLTVADFKKIVGGKMLADFDPVAEAFSVYDPDGTGFVDIDILGEVFRKLDFGDITSDDLNVLVATADADGDGKISLADFRDMLYANDSEKKS